MSDTFGEASAIEGGQPPIRRPMPLDSLEPATREKPSDAARPATSRISVRLSTDDLDRIDADAARLGATRSDYIRTVLSLPVRIDIDVFTRAQHGVETLAAVQSIPPALVIGDPPHEVQVMTDDGLSAVRGELNAIGVNYNQCVRALNRINRKYGNRKTLTDAAKDEFLELLERVSKQNGVIFSRVNAVEDRVADLASRPGVPLRVSKRPSAATPINKTDAPSEGDPERRKRTRGRKHRGGDSDRPGYVSSENGSSTPGGAL